MSQTLFSLALSIGLCGSLPAEGFGWWPEGSSHHLVQKGTVTVVDGQEAKVLYKKAYHSPPHLVITGFNQSWFRQKPYRLDDFQIIQQEAGFFRIQSNHAEVGNGSWAVLEWRAEGMPATDADKTGVEAVVARIEKLKGQVTRDDKAPGRPLTTIDLHGTRVTDADLVMLEGLTQLKTLNLYDTPITDAALAHMSGLVRLEVLHLSSTAINGSGLQYLARLPALREVNLHKTQVSDDSMQYLAGLANLWKLTLSDTPISDRALQFLKSAKKLHYLLVSRTHVSDGGLQDLKRALPELHIVR